MRAFLFAAILALSAASSALAGDSPADKPDDSHLAAAMDLLDVNGSLSNLSAMLDAVAPVQAMEIQHQQPNLSAEQIRAIQAAVKNEMVSRIDELKRIVAAGYAEQFSEDELKTLAAFYRTDVGRKYIATIPVLLKSLAPAETAWALAVASDAVRKAMRPRSEEQHT